MKTIDVYMLLHETVSIVDMYVLPEVYILVKSSLKTFENFDRALDLRAWPAWVQTGQVGVPVVITLYLEANYLTCWVFSIK